MYWLDHWRPFLMLAVVLIVVGMVRSAWATRLDGFTVDEPWHVTAGVGCVCHLTQQASDIVWILVSRGQKPNLNGVAFHDVVVNVVVLFAKRGVRNSHVFGVKAYKQTTFAVIEN